MSTQYNNVQAFLTEAGIDLVVTMGGERERVTLPYGSNQALFFGDNATFELNEQGVGFDWRDFSVDLREAQGKNGIYFWAPLGLSPRVSLEDALKRQLAAMKKGKK